MPQEIKLSITMLDADLVFQAICFGDPPLMILSERFALAGLETPGLVQR
jgi:hypothetical protein